MITRSRRVAASGRLRTVPLVVFALARVISLLAVVVLATLVIFDARAERFTAGRTPAQFSARLDPSLLLDYDQTIGIAHNAGDALRPATEAVAYGVDGVEIDVRSTGSELYASHDAPVRSLEDLVFRGPTLQRAWDIASLRPTVLLHLKERSPRYLRAVHAFLASHPLRRVIAQTGDPGTLRVLARTDPQVTRVLLILSPKDLGRLRRDRGLLRLVDGVSVRDRLLTPQVLAGFERQRLETFAWVVNDERRMNELIRAGLDGLITERLDIMRLLGSGTEVAR